MDRHRQHEARRSSNESNSRFAIVRHTATLDRNRLPATALFTGLPR
jgi:hypothetical protein